MTTGPLEIETAKVTTEVGIHAGKKIVDAVASLVKLWLSPSLVRREALAEEERKTIAHTGELERQERTALAQRKFREDELEHILVLTERAQGRFHDTLLRDQLRIEYVANKAEELANTEEEEGRDINTDWLHRFFDYASKVDEETILSVFSRALADAATKGKPILPPKALDTLRFFDTTIFNSFSRIVGIVSVFGFMFRSRYEFLDIPEWDGSQLIEMGLVKIEQVRHLNLRIGNSSLMFAADVGSPVEFNIVKLTHVGKAIAGLLQKEMRVLLPALEGQSYSEHVFHLQLNNGLSSAVCTSIANDIVSTLSDFGKIIITSHIYKISGNAIISESIRSTSNDPFSIPVDDILNAIENPETQNYMARILDIFTDFDEYTLPCIREMQP